MSTPTFERRQVLRLVGTGAILGSFAGKAAAKEGDGPQPYIVGVTSKAAENAARSQAARVNRVIRLGRATAVAGNFSPQAAEALSGRPGVKYVEEDIEMHAIDGDVETVNSWGVDRVDAEVAHGAGHTGSGTHIAIIDTGIDSNHPDLEANLGVGHAVAGYEADGSIAWEDDNGHGTHCAGIAAARDDGSGVVGVAPLSTLHAVKVLDGSGSGSASSVAAGIEWVANNAANWGPTVASLSLGGGRTEALKDACQYAYDEGVLVVAAAGNSGNSIPPCKDDCINYPARYETVIAVTATNRCDVVSNWSSKGPEAELAAPGAVIYSTVPGDYDTFSGTSMACPHVSGAGALLMAGGTSNTDARTKLTSSVEDVGLSSTEGAGLLDVAASLNLADGDGLPSPLNQVSTDGTDGTTLNGTVVDGFFGCSEFAGYFEWWRSGDKENTFDTNETSAAIVTRDDPSFSYTPSLEQGVEYKYQAVARDGDTPPVRGTEVTFTAVSSESGDDGGNGGGNNGGGKGGGKPTR